jgi:60 kDa SS-A/Ro ribonucleoprotein
MGMVEAIGARRTGAGTNFPSVFNRAIPKYDRIILLSDMQGWMSGGAPTSEFAAYKRNTGADPHVYSFDLQGYGTLMFPERQVYCLAGFSDRIFGIMKTLEEDPKALISRIESVEL